MQPSSYFHNLLAYYQKIVPYVEFYKKKLSYYNHMALYKKQISYYNCMTPEILTNEIGLKLPTYPKDRRHRRSILASILGGIASSVIGLAYEGSSSFLHHKRNKALHKAVRVMENKTDKVQQNTSLGRYHDYVQYLQFRHFDGINRNHTQNA